MQWYIVTFTDSTTLGNSALIKFCTLLLIKHTFFIAQVRFVALDMHEKTVRPPDIRSEYIPVLIVYPLFVLKFRCSWDSFHIRV